MKQQPRISAKKLGLILEGTSCPRCRWFLLRGKPPFSIFPAVFNYLDRLIKRGVRGYIDKHKKPPSWFGPFSNARSYREVGQLHHFDKKSGILLTGEPDEVLIVSELRGAVLDYKVTRKPDNAEGGLYSVYQIQLASYKYLCNLSGDLPEIERVGLVYMDPSGTEYSDSVEPIDDDGLLVHFKGKVQVINLPAEDLIPKSLAKIRTILDQEAPPPPAEGCADCRIVSHIIKLMGGEHFVDYEQAMLAHRVARMMQERGLRLQEALLTIRYQDSTREGNGDSAPWDWLGEDEEW